jgi:C4-dicarboxylate transporter DctM subunit
MEPLAFGAVLLVFGLALLAIGLWVAPALLVIGYVGVVAFSPAPAGQIMATTMWGGSSSWSLTALPMFIWMGEILFRTKLAEQMFEGLWPWVTKLPGRLLHVNVLACGIFAAVCGSSPATCATIGRMTYPELMKRGYDERLAIGTLAGSGTLGILIPPSIIMIVYGVAAEVSIPRLFIAGVIPGAILMMMFSGYVVVWALLNPDRIPLLTERMSLPQRLKAGRQLFPVLTLIILVVGAIYAGFATATEAAVVGVAGALLISAASRTLTWATFKDSCIHAMQTSCMIAFIIAGASFMTIAMQLSGVPRELALWIGSMHLTQVTLILALTLLYLVLGCFLEGISMVVLTTSVLMPIIQAANIDLVWFGVFLVIVCEMGMITPPVGLNLFVLQHLTGKNIFWIARAALPYLTAMVALVIVMIIWPSVVTYLPNSML